MTTTMSSPSQADRAPLGPLASITGPPPIAPKRSAWTPTAPADSHGQFQSLAAGQVWRVSPTKSFVCKGERGTRPFNPNAYVTADKTLSALWDFGPDPTRHCSYSYHMPYGPQRLTVSSVPGLRDRRRPQPVDRWAGLESLGFRLFRPSGTVQEQKAGNAIAHSLDGQNVMFLDTHVDFQKRSTCGLDGDNIYTSWDGQDKARGVPPKLGSVPADKLDSLLVNDPVLPTRDSLFPVAYRPAVRYDIG